MSSKNSRMSSGKGNYRNHPYGDKNGKSSKGDSSRSNSTITSGNSGFTVERKPNTVLRSLYFWVEFHKPTNQSENSYFHLVIPGRPECTLRLYRNAMIRLCEQIPKAIKQCQFLQDMIDDNMRYDVDHDIAVINETKKNMMVKLYTQIYEGAPYIFVRLFVDRASLPQRDGEGNDPAYFDGVPIEHTEDDEAQPESEVVKKDPKEIDWVASKKGVRISPVENLSALVDFVAQNY